MKGQRDFHLEGQQISISTDSDLHAGGQQISRAGQPSGTTSLPWRHGWQRSSTGELVPAAVPLPPAPLRGRRSPLIDFLGHGYSAKPHDFARDVSRITRTTEAMGLTADEW